MGIRVNKDALLRQLKSSGQEQRVKLLFHRQLLDNALPQSIGGGIGQSRLCMFLLRKAHIGEVQVSLWPEEHQQQYAEQRGSIFISAPACSLFIHATSEPVPGVCS
jgi:aspartate--ammonia ligase